MAALILRRTTTGGRADLAPPGLRSLRPMIVVFRNAMARYVVFRFSIFVIVGGSWSEDGLLGHPAGRSGLSFPVFRASGRSRRTDPRQEPKRRPPPRPPPRRNEPAAAHASPERPRPPERHRTRPRRTAHDPTRRPPKRPGRQPRRRTGPGPGTRRDRAGPERGRDAQHAS